MTDINQISTQKIKTKMELLTEATHNVTVIDVNKNSTHPFLERLAAIANEFTRLNDENEARKPPELKAIEAARDSETWRKEREEKLLKEEFERRKKLTTLYQRFKPYDVWNLKSEAIPLLYGIEPNPTESPTQEISQAWEISERSVLAGNLIVVNKQSKSSEWLVSPTDFYLWAFKRGMKILEEFDQMFGLKHYESLANHEHQKKPKTLIATETKTRSKARRLAKVREFRTWIDGQTELQGYTWRHNLIPDTKQSAYRIFINLYPEVVKVAQATFDDNLHDAGFRFSNKKTLEINPLETIYRNRK